MKKLEELGISPTPWSVGYESYNLSIFTPPRKIDGVKMMICGEFGNEASAHLMAAAPEMYEALLEALPLLADIGAEVVGNDAAEKIAAVVAKAEAALRNAAGENEVAE